MSAFWKNTILWTLAISIVLSQVGGALSAFATHEPGHIIEEDLGGSGPIVKPKTNQQPVGNTGGKFAVSKFDQADSDSGCGGEFFFGVKPGQCALYVVAWISYMWLKIVGLILEVAGLVFNATLGIAIDNSNYTAETVPALGHGWNFSRDIVNLFFIFIILFIAISTVLGIESYSARRLLGTLIIMALLVNFSFLIAQSIIFISNALTVELYELIPESQYAWFPSASKLLSFDYHKDISGALTDAFAPQNLVNNDTIPQELGKAAGVPLFLAMIEICIIGTIMILAAAFVLFAGAFFLIARMIIFWFLLIFAPFGFVFMILPQTKGQANRWWKTLSDQAIFAPAFLFMLLLAIMIVQSGLADFLKQSATKTTGEFLFLLALQGIIMVGIVIGCLLVAKTMGAYGAGAAMGMVQSRGKAFRGYVGRTATGLRRRAVGTPAGWVAKKMNESRIANMPGIGAVTRTIAKPFEAAQRARLRENDERENKYKAMSSKALASMYRSSVRPSNRKEILKIAAENRKMKDFRPEEIETAMQQNKGNSKALRGIYAVRPDLVAKNFTDPVDQQNAVTTEVARMSEADIRDNLDGAALKDDNFRKAIVQKFGAQKMIAILNKFGDEAKEAIDDGLRKIGGIAPVFDELYENNRDLLRGLFSNPELTIELKDLKTNIEGEINKRTAAGTLKVGNNTIKDLEEFKQHLRV